MNLSNLTIVITGGSSGMGLVFAKQFLRPGSEVIIFACLNAPAA